MKTIRIGKTAAISYPLWVGILFLTLLLGGCAEKKHVPLEEPALNQPTTIYPKKVKRKPDNSDTIAKMLRDEFNDWKGTPHRMGGCSKKGIDCSCFVRKIYEDLFYYDVNNLPRTVKGLATMEKRKLISKNDLQPGDLVIFQQPPPWYPHHVGIFLGDNEFIHASKSKGVIISRMDDAYHWAKYYSKSLRLLTEKDKQKIIERRGFIANSKRTDEIVDNDIKRIEYGKASYYADKFHGRTTTCGERYNRNQLTAAHKELPCGSICRITHLGNGKSVVVVINDRGPFIKGRIIDLSHRAMKQLGAISAGVIEVKLELL